MEKVSDKRGKDSERDRQTRQRKRKDWLKRKLQT